MTHYAAVLNTWARLPPEVRSIAAPIQTQAQYHQTLELFEEVWNEVGQQANHLLGSLFVLQREHVTVYQERVHPVAAVPAHRVLYYLMDERGSRHTQLAEVLCVTQSNVSRLLSGQTSFSLETARRLAEFFKVSPQVLLS